MPADVEACVSALQGKIGVDDPHALCAWMKTQGKALPGTEAEVGVLVVEFKRSEKRDRRATSYRRALGLEAAHGVVQDKGDSWSFQVNPSEGFEKIDPEPVALDAARGVLAVMGDLKDGDLDVVELRFQKSAGWDLDTVRSYVAQHGFEGLRSGHEALAASKVREEADFWVIPETVVARPGVVNGWLRPWEELKRLAGLWDGVPVTHGHPAGTPMMASEAGLIAGVLKAPRVDEAQRRIVAEVWLARKSLPGLQVSAEGLKKNEESVRRIRAGRPPDGSPGYSAMVRPQVGTEAGKGFDHVARLLKPDHYAVLLDQTGGCSQAQGCGPAAAAANENLHDPAPPGKGGAPEPRRRTMPDECKGGTECQSRGEQLRHATEALNQMGTLVGKANAPHTEIVSAVKEHLDALRGSRDAELRERDTLAAEVAKAEAALGIGKEDTLQARYKAWPLQALRDHRASLEAAIARGASRSDATRVAAAAEAQKGPYARSGNGLVVSEWGKR